MTRRRAFALVAMTALLIVPAATARAGQLLTNGGFEAGGFTGWALANRPLGAPYNPPVPAAGRFVIGDTSDQAPLSGADVLGVSPSALGPSSGDFYALSDMTAAGTHALLQAFTVPVGTTALSLSFDMYVYDWAGFGGAVDPIGLDHDTPNPNQHARVDLLTSGAGAFDTSAASVVENFYLGVDPESALGRPPVYRHYSFDLTGVALPGQTYQLRFGEVDNEFVLNQAVDDVSLVASSAVASVPEPSTRIALLSGVPLVLIRLRRRARNRHLVT
jgi:hypothetical protein